MGERIQISEIHASHAILPKVSGKEVNFFKEEGFLRWRRGVAHYY